MTIIKTETIRFVRVKAVHYIFLTVIITAIVLLAAVAVANAMQISMLVSNIEAMQRKVDALKGERETGQTPIEGQASSKERIDMTTYFKITPETLFSEAYTSKGLKVKTMVFRDDDEKCSIDVISLDSRSRFVCYEQWSLPGNKKDYRQCHKELRRFAGLQLGPSDGRRIFEKHEDKYRPKGDAVEEWLRSVYENPSMLF